MSRDTAGWRGVAEWAGWLFIVIAVGRLTELVPGLGQLPLAKICAVIWLIAVVVRSAPKGMPPLLSIPMVRTALALLVVAVITAPFSIWRGGSVMFLLNVGAICTLAFALICRTANAPEFAVGTLRCLVFTATMLALTALAFSGGRISAGITYDTNDLAYVLVSVLPLAIGFAVLNTGRKRVTYAAIAALLVVSALLTQSRGAFLSLLTITLFMIFVDLKPPETPVKAGKAVSKRISRLLVCILMGLVTWGVLPPETRERLSTVVSLKDDYNMDTENITSRGSIWKRNLSALADRPVGFGLDTFTTVDGRYGGKWKAPHNSLLQVGVELGVLGFVLFMRMYVLAWKGLGQSIDRTADGTRSIERIVLSRALRVSLASNFVAGFFLSMAYSSLLWTFLATIVVFIYYGSLPPDVAAVKKPGLQRRSFRTAPTGRSTSTIAKAAKS